MSHAADWSVMLADHLGSRRDLRAVVAHLAGHLDAVAPEPHLLHVDSDLCAAGHVHMAIVVWALSTHDLVILEATEEHYDHDEAVETTFQADLTAYPLDAVEGTRLSSELHPDGSLVSRALTVPVRARESAMGTAIPVFCDDPQCDADHGYDLDVRAAPPTFVTTQADVDLDAFAAELRARRRTTRGR